MIDLIEYANLCKYVEFIPIDNNIDVSGCIININGESYKGIKTIYANDLATDVSPLSSDLVSIGLVLQDSQSNFVVAIRGTKGILEWVHDFEFGMSSDSRFMGSIEDGFLQMYNSLSIFSQSDKSYRKLIDYISFLSLSDKSITICGHSLGAALATILSVDILNNNYNINPNLYVYASPRVGDKKFVSTLNLISNYNKISNRLDVITQLPPRWLGYDDSQINLELLPNDNIKEQIWCEHDINTYVYLLSLLDGIDNSSLLQDQCRV